MEIQDTGQQIKRKNDNYIQVSIKVNFLLDMTMLELVTSMVRTFPLLMIQRPKKALEWDGLVV